MTEEDNDVEYSKKLTTDEILNTMCSEIDIISRDLDIIEKALKDAELPNLAEHIEILIGRIRSLLTYIRWLHLKTKQYSDSSDVP